MARDAFGHQRSARRQRPARTAYSLAVAVVAALLAVGTAIGYAGPAQGQTEPAGATAAESAVTGADETPIGGTGDEPPPTEPAEPTASATPSEEPTEGSPPAPDPTATTTLSPPDPTVTTALPPPDKPTTGAPPPPDNPTTAPPPPASQPPGQPGPQQPGTPRHGVYITTGDITLTDDYWGTPSTVADLRVTVANTGEVTELIRLSYWMPSALSDAGTPGCSASGNGGWQCASWTVSAGARFSTHVRVRVDGDAWKQMPLSGSVVATATVQGNPSIAAVTDNQGFAVLFPAGPPVPGVSLSASEVNFDITGQATTLEVRLGNTGRTDATGTVEVILPPGVTVPTVPAGCVAAAADRTRCDLGAIQAGDTGTARLPVSATPEAQRNAPLAGAVVGTLTPRAGKAKRIQMSFRITAVAALSTPAAFGGALVGSQGALPPVDPAGGSDGGLTSVQKTAIALITASLLLVVLALGLATTSLRRRLGGDPPVGEVTASAE